MNATCLPLSIACSAASAATIVLPDPTSPCSSRCIGDAWRMSCAISRHTRSCARVSLNGTRASSAFVSAPVPVSTGARRCARAFRCALRDSCCASSSSNLRRVHAGCVRASSARCVSSDSRGGGVCRKRIASPNFHSLRRVIICSGSVSSVYAGSAASVRATSLRNVSCARPAVVGYTGVSRSGSGVSSATTLNCGCTISMPK